MSTTGISKNCAPRKKAAATTSSTVQLHRSRLIFFEHDFFFFLSLSLSLFTSSYDLFSPRFPRENGKLVRVWAGKKQERIFPSIPGALFHRVFVSYFEEFRAKDGDGSLFWRQPGINERHARRIARMYKSLNKSVSKYLYHTFPLSSLVLSDTAEHSETCCSRRSDYSYVVFWRDLKKI